MDSWLVDAQSAGTRADAYIAAQMSISRAEAQRIIDGAEAQVNGKTTKAAYRLREGDTVQAQRPEPVPTAVTPEDIPLSVVYEDSDLMVINKPRGMVVHPAPGAWTGTLVNAVLAHADDLSGIGGELRPGIVHRLDKDTSGLLMIAKNDEAHRSLQAQIQAKTAERRYMALVWGVPAHKRTIIDAPIGRHPADRKKMAVITDQAHKAREAMTQLSVVEPLGAFCLTDAKLYTGRTHQIRVHCAYIGHQVVGDPLYGGNRKTPHDSYSTKQRQQIEQAIIDLHGQALHAYSLSFDHPRTGERIALQSEMPSPMKQLIELLRDMR